VALIISGTEVSFLVGAIVALGGALLMIARLPSAAPTPSATSETDPESNQHP
jgi:hypothetical protein